MCTNAVTICVEYIAMDSEILIDSFQITFLSLSKSLGEVTMYPKQYTGRKEYRYLVGGKKCILCVLFFFLTFVGPLDTRYRSRLELVPRAC